MKTKYAPSGPVERCTLDAPTQSLLNLIFNHDMFKDAMKSFDIGKVARRYVGIRTCQWRTRDVVGLSC